MDMKSGCSINTSSEGKRRIDKLDDGSVTLADTLSICSSESDETSCSQVSISDTWYDKNYRTTSRHVPLGLEQNIPALKKVTKHVTFSNTVQLNFIPTRLDLGLIKHYIWWSQSEIQYFKMEANRDLANYICLHKCSAKEALTKLYQHSIEELDK